MRRARRGPCVMATADVYTAWDEVEIGPILGGGAHLVALRMRLLRTRFDIC